MARRFSTGLRNKLAGITTNLISNGAFGTDTSGWTGSGATLTRDLTAGVDSGPALKIANSGAAAGKAYTDITTVAGRAYLLEMYLDVGDAGGMQVLVGSTSDDDAIQTSASFTDTSLTKKSIAFVATGTTTRITVLVGSTTSGQFVLVDDVVCEEVLDGLRGIFKGAKLNLYTGTQPTSPDDAATGTLIATISLNSGSDGFEFTSAASGVIGKPSGVTWSGVNVASGTQTIGYGRLYETGDSPGSSSTTAARYDFSIGTSGADVNVSSVSAANGATTTFTQLDVTVPATA